MNASLRVRAVSTRNKRNLAWATDLRTVQPGSVVLKTKSKCSIFQDTKATLEVIFQRMYMAVPTLKAPLNAWPEALEEVWILLFKIDLFHRTKKHSSFRNLEE